MVQNAPYSIEINVLEQIVFLELCPIFDGSLHHLSDRYEKNSPQCKMALMHMGAKKRKKIGFPRPNLVVNLSSCPVAIINAIFKYLILSHDFLTFLMSRQAPVLQLVQYPTPSQQVQVIQSKQSLMFSVHDTM